VDRGLLQKEQTCFQEQGLWGVALRGEVQLSFKKTHVVPYIQSAGAPPSQKKRKEKVKSRRKKASANCAENCYKSFVPKARDRKNTLILLLKKGGGG